MIYIAMITLLLPCGYAWVNLSVGLMHSIVAFQRSTKLSLFQDFSNDDDMFRLSQSDITRIERLRERNLKIPILITQTCILPGQTMNIFSADPKFQKLIDYVEHNQQEVGIIGIHPQTQKPLNFGVTSNILNKGIKKNSILGVSVLIEGKRQFRIDDESFMDPSGSFYMAKVEIIDDKEEFMTAEQKKEAEQLSDKIPFLVTKWKHLVLKKGLEKELWDVMKSIGPMPSCVRNRAIWVGMLVNPLTDLKLCVEIRPAMLACRNNHERIHLAVLSMQHSIDFLSQMKK